VSPVKYELGFHIPEDGILLYKNKVEYLVLGIYKFIFVYLGWTGYKQRVEVMGVP
jgi:hypothetical protein